MSIETECRVYPCKYLIKDYQWGDYDYRWFCEKDYQYYCEGLCFYNELGVGE